MCNYKRLLALILTIGIPFILYSQENENKYTYSAGGNIFKGFIYRHTKSIGHLITEHPTGFELYAYKSTYGDREWQSLYNYPDIGVSLVMVNYHNPELGKSIATLIYNDIYLTSHSKSNHLKLKIGGGLAYHTKHYDEYTNPRNNILSTDFTYALQMRLEYGVALNKWKLTSALTLNHFSNGSIKKPNKGVNVPSVSLGISRQISDYKLEYQNPDPVPFDRNIHANINLATGFTSTDIARDKIFMSYNLSFYIDKRISRRSIVNAGVDFFANYAVKEFIKYDFKIDGPVPDFKRIGLVAGHEFFMGRTAVLIQMGYYVYRPYKYDSLLYQRYGLKYFISDRYFTSIYLKAHNGNAEMAEWALGIRL